MPKIDPSREPGAAEVVGLLLDAGASPNTNDGGRPRYRSALRGSVELNNPGVTEMLLDAGAHPDPGQPIGDAITHRDQRCLRLLLSHGARVARTWALGAAVYNDNAGAMSLLLEALEAAGAGAAEQATEALPDAVANASDPVVAALLDAGADPRAAGTRGPYGGARLDRHRRHGRYRPAYRSRLPRPRPGPSRVAAAPRRQLDRRLPEQ